MLKLALEDEASGAAVVAADDALLSAMTPAALNGLVDRHGAVLFRGVEGGLAAFKAFSSRCAQEFSDYRGGGLRFGPLDREAIGGDRTVLTVTGAGQAFAIPLHGEMQYLPEPPELLWFYCDRPPVDGGQTTYASAAAVERALGDETRAFFASNRILYRRVLSVADWPKTFLTDDLEEARRFCARQRLALAVRESGAVDVSFVTDAIRTDADGGRHFINNILFVQRGEDAFLSGYARQALGVDVEEWPFVVRTEAGDPIPRAIIDDIARASERVTRDIDWQKGDFLVLDNRRVLHGRRECGAGERRILVRMSNRRSA